VTIVRHLECPHCRNWTMSLWTKLFLGPGRTVACANCGGRMSVPRSGIWVIVPGVIAIWASLFIIESRPLAIVVFAVGMAVSSILHCRFLPLTAR
jgi:ribosomal protein S27E